jgi:hypothetical protein
MLSKFVRLSLTLLFFASIGCPADVKGWCHKSCWLSIRIENVYSYQISVTKSDGQTTTATVDTGKQVDGEFKLRSGEYIIHAQYTDSSGHTRSKVQEMRHTGPLRQRFA